MMAKSAVAVQVNDKLLERLKQARVETDALFRIIRPEFLYDRPIPERHRVVFYIGHLEAFDWNLLHAVLGVTTFQPGLDRLFAFGIDPVDGSLPSDLPSDWPSLQQVYAYRDGVRERLDSALERCTADGLDQLLNVAIEHRLMHAETLAYIFHQMVFEKKSEPGLRMPPSFESTVTPRRIAIPQGEAKLGISSGGTAFGWDNEFEAHGVQVPAFEIDKYKVTNGQFLGFLKDGGYARRDFWSEANWAWKEARAIRHPAFWIPEDGGWMWRGMFEKFPLPPDWPVYVSHAEASAYTKWANTMAGDSGCGLPTEAQWHRAAYGADGGEDRAYPWGRQHTPSEPHDGNYEPAPVNALESSAFGVAGMLGNGWEWTSSKFEPFPGFRRFDCYPGYSEPFFDGKHFVLKGGSVRTAACMLRRSFRNWFQPQYQYVYAGFRCVSTKEPQA